MIGKGEKLAKMCLLNGLANINKLIFSWSNGCFYFFPNKLWFLYARRRRDVLWDHPWRAGGRVGGWASGRAASTSLSGAYLQNYSSYGYEISWVDRSHQGGVQCAGIITLASLIFQFLPFVFFHT